MLSSDVPRVAYEFGGQRWLKGAPGFAEAIAKAYGAHQRPRCMCLLEGVEMYVASLGGSFVVKRMPDTGSRHAPDCPSYEPPAESSGLGQVLGSAITEDRTTGATMLKLDFPLTKLPGRSQAPLPGGDSDSVARNGTRLSLLGLLHYLWDQAALTRWHPGFAGKRTWATVRRHLLQAAEHKLAGGSTLGARLYVPEPFSPDQRDAINARRLAQWQHAMVIPGKPQHLMLLVGDAKEIVSARYGVKVIVKHVPDQAFTIDEQLYMRLGRHFETEFALWSASDDIHMLMIATFGLHNAGIPAIHQLCLMPVTRHWLPVRDGFEKQLLDKLVGESRSFVKGLQYNLRRQDQIASATLLDCDGSTPMLFVLANAPAESARGNEDDNLEAPAWTWRSFAEPMPPFPAHRTLSIRSGTSDLRS